MKRRRWMPSREALARELAGLPDLTRADLLGRFRALYGQDPPRQISRPLLVLAVGYRMQERVFGGLKPKVRHALARAAKDIAAGRHVAPSHTPRPGTRLVREWQGVTYEAILLEDGVLFRGERYASLSQIARIITGTRWSGPLFFGLRRQGKERER